MQIERIADDAFIAIGETYHSNATVFINNGDVLLIDALGGPADAEELRRIIEVDLGKRVRMIVATHYFSDHIAALKLFPDAHILAHALYRQTFDSELYRTAGEAAAFVEPTIVIDTGARIRWGRFTLRVSHNPGHTPSTLSIEVPEERLLFIGDTVVDDIVYLAYSSPEVLSTALERLERSTAERLVTSHGGMRSRAIIANAREYLNRLREMVIGTLGSGKDAVRAIDIRSCLAPGLAPTAVDAIYHERNLAVIVDRSLFVA